MMNTYFLCNYGLTCSLKHVGESLPISDQRNGCFMNVCRCNRVAFFFFKTLIRLVLLELYAKIEPLRSEIYSRPQISSSDCIEFVVVGIQTEQNL